MNLGLRLQLSLTLCSVAFIRCPHSVAQQDQPLRLEVNVNKVLIPVVVRDKQGRPVGVLKREDFQVFDNDKLRPVSAFSVERRGPPLSNSATGTENGGPPSNATSSQPPAPQRFIVFLFDDLHLSPEDLAQAKNAAVKVISEALVGRDIGAVISLSQKTNSGLTRDRARMQSAIMSMQSRSLLTADNSDCPHIDYYQADLIDNKHDSMAIQDAVRKVFECNPSLDPRFQENVAENMADSAARRVLAIGHQDVQTTYASIAAFVRSMANLPGDRLMVLISPGFLRLEQDSLTAESRLMDLAAQSDVTISALDARGLYTTEISASEKSPALAGPSLTQNQDYRRAASIQAEDPLAEIADATGGTFFHNSNDLGAGFKALTATPEVMYLLELPADTAKSNSSYHRLKVKVDRDGLEVQARRGYYVPKPQKAKK